ncbi:hypothetical protein GCM10027039_40690 [Terrabacter koreensis]
MLTLRALLTVMEMQPLPATLPVGQSATVVTAGVTAAAAAGATAGTGAATADAASGPPSCATPETAIAVRPAMSENERLDVLGEITATPI